MLVTSWFGSNLCIAGVAVDASNASLAEKVDSTDRHEVCQSLLSCVLDTGDYFIQCI